jgi:hypothetical protein
LKLVELEGLKEGIVRNALITLLMSMDLKVRTKILEACKKSINHTTRHGGAWVERRYSSYSFLTSALEGGEY